MTTPVVQVLPVAEDGVLCNKDGCTTAATSYIIITEDGGIGAAGYACPEHTDSAVTYMEGSYTAALADTKHAEGFAYFLLADVLVNNIDTTPKLHAHLCHEFSTDPGYAAYVAGHLAKAAASAMWKAWQVEQPDATAQDLYDAIIRRAQRCRAEAQELDDADGGDR